MSYERIIYSTEFTEKSPPIPPQGGINAECRDVACRVRKTTTVQRHCEGNSPKQSSITRHKPSFFPSFGGGRGGSNTGLLRYARNDGNGKNHINHKNHSSE